MKYIVRNRNSKENIIINTPKALVFLYDFLFGRLILKLIYNRVFANIVSKYMNSKLSKWRIKRFINKNKIDMSEYEEKEYSSFNDFFIRRVKSNKRIINKDNNILISPCDSKLSVYKINKDLTLKIKGSFYSINTLVEKDILRKYINGYALVFRLDTTDYHRYCYIDEGYQNENVHIKGKLHTVQPITLKNYNYFVANEREYTTLFTNNFSEVIHIEIGALIIGKITNLHKNYKFKKGEEKGYFEFGGSTIVLLFKKDTIRIDEDIINNSKENIETIVKYGSKIGKKYIKK